MKKISKFLVLLIGLSAVTQIAIADILTPTETTVYFTADSEPYNKPVDYTVDCYGATYYPQDGEDIPEDGTYTPSIVYSYTASCPEYGCKIYEPYYLNYRHIDYCDLTGTTEGQTFEIKNFSGSPVSNCENVEQPFIMSDGEHYYKSTPEYEACLLEDEGNWDTCDSLMAIVPDSEIEKDPDGHPLEEKCTMTFEIPAVIDEEIEPLFIFDDVSSMYTYFDAINYVKTNKIVSGYSDGRYKPENPINRAEFTKIIIGAVFSEEEINSCTKENIFSDVPNSEWYTKYVCFAKEHQIISGYEDGTFRPGNDINFAEAAKIIVEAFGFEIGSTTNPWYAPFVKVMEAKKAIPLSIDSLSKNITRAEMAEMIYRLKANITTKESATLLPTQLQ